MVASINTVNWRKNIIQQARILVVGDELAVVQTCRKLLSRVGHIVDSVLSVQEAVANLDFCEYDIVFFDLKLAGGELIERIKEAYPATVVVILHGIASLAASDVLGRGVYEYLSKPVTSEALFAALGRALQQRTLLIQAHRTSAGDNVSEFGELVGNGPAMRSLFRLINKVAPTGAAVLIMGQVGTGKKLAAKAIHQTSPRRGEPLIEVETGMKVGAFLSRVLFGSVARIGGQPVFSPGKIEEAGSGTIYVDEFAVLDHWGQRQLINCILTRSYLPVNGTDPRPVACRFILGTTRHLGISAENAEIIEDLYTKVSVFPICLPTIAERSEDIPALTYQFMRRFAARFDKQIDSVDDRLLTRLMARPWSGNVRELERAIERMVSICDEDILTLEHYQQAMEDTGYAHWDGKPPTTIDDLKEVKKHLRRAAIREVERDFVIDALQRSNGNVTHAAKEIGMQRRNLQALMREYGIKAG